MDEKFVKDLGFNSRALHAGQKPDPTTGSIKMPVYLSSTYIQEAPGKHKGFEYSRSQNPTRIALENCVASLEKVKHGIAFSSGLSAASSVIHLLKSGDHVLASDDLYGGTHRMFNQVYTKMGIEFDFVDTSNIEIIRKRLKTNTKLIWLESPTNPMMKVCDMAAISKLAHEKEILTLMDNTFMSPYFQNPTDYSIDLILHSTTKYINGHTDVVGGIILTDSKDLNEKLKYIQNSVGAVPGAMDSYMVLRGIKTLGLRMERHESNAMAVAKHLETSDKVEIVFYPGLKSHPQHEIARKQMRGFGGMVTFILKGTYDHTKTFLKNLKLFSLAESLGGAESLVNHPAAMTHASVPEKTRIELGITDNLIRLSVGLENESDLIDDLSQALNSI